MVTSTLSSALFSPVTAALPAARVRRNRLQGVVSGTPAASTDQRQLVAQVHASGQWDGRKVLQVQASNGKDRECRKENQRAPSALHTVTPRRSCMTSLALMACLQTAAASPAVALGDSSVTVADVTRVATPSQGPLPPTEAATVSLFESATFSVVNVFDSSLRPQVNLSGSVEVPEGNGSGVVWDTEGHIVTNYHVLGSSLALKPSRGASVARITILTPDGSQRDFVARLVGADRTKDLAVVKVDAPKEFLRPLPLLRPMAGQQVASVDQTPAMLPPALPPALRVGQRCLAIGNPFGFDHTLTVGVIGGLERDIYSQAGVVIGGGIQTDAAINPGNSGGPLLDSQGHLIGINTAIFTNTGTSSGVGFAIPVSTVERVVQQLLYTGEVVRAGINAQFATAAVAKQLNVTRGALVLTVPQGSAALSAGLLPTRRSLGGLVLGDIITSVNSHPIKDLLELSKLLDAYAVGDVVTVAVRRAGTGAEEVTLQVQLERVP